MEQQNRAAKKPMPTHRDNAPDENAVAAPSKRVVE
jgi:hypothetical protein